MMVSGKEIILVDFAGLGEDGVMAQFTALKNLVMAKNKKVPGCNHVHPQELWDATLHEACAR